jgi:hypothetical protein
VVRAVLAAMCHWRAGRESRNAETAISEFAAIKSTIAPQLPHGKAIKWVPTIAAIEVGQWSGFDPERSDESPNSCRSRVRERTLTAPLVDPDRLPLSQQPSSAKLSHLG